MFPNGILIVFIVSLVMCCMGFKKFVWFMSVGYGLSAAGIGAALLVMSLVRGQYSLIYLVQCVLFVVYGIRLGGFLLIRELKNDKYKAKLAEAGGEAKVPVFVAAVMWIFMGALYVAQASPAFYRLANGFAKAVGRAGFEEQSLCECSFAAAAMAGEYDVFDFAGFYLFHSISPYRRVRVPCAAPLV